mgnify:CR=1 FL=1
MTPEQNALFDLVTWDFPGAAIEAESFRRIEAEVPPEQRARFSPSEWHIARRLVHTTADFEILPHLRCHGDPVGAGRAALRRGALIYSDSNMIKAGLSVPKLKRFHPGYTRDSILCEVASPDVAELAKRENITRALAAVKLHAPELEGAVFLCGNAPLALAGVVRLAVERGVVPALIVGMPVGFVNVVESKKLLDLVDIPFVRINGRRGGSPLAVAALHGMMEGELQ